MPAELSVASISYVGGGRGVSHRAARAAGVGDSAQCGYDAAAGDVEGDAQRGAGEDEGGAVGWM